MISFKNNIKKSTLSFKVIVVCLLLSTSLGSPGFANGFCYTVVEPPVAVVSNKALTSNVVTLTSVAHGFGLADSVTITGVDATFNGVYTITGITTNTFTYSKTAADVGSVASGGVATLGRVLTDDGTCTGEIVIDNTVTNIGQNAFYRNTALTGVTIGNSVTSISRNAFSESTALTSVTIFDSVLIIGDYAFNNSGLTSVTIPDSVTSIGNNAFRGNTALTFVNIGNSVITIGDNAFLDNILLTTVTIPDSVISIGDGAFRGNLALRSVIVGNSVTSIGNNAFRSNTLLRSVRFLRTTPPTVGSDVFLDVTGARAKVRYNATLFGANGDVWNRLTVELGSNQYGASWEKVEGALTADDEIGKRLFDSGRDTWVDTYELVGVPADASEVSIYVKSNNTSTGLCDPALVIYNVNDPNPRSSVARAYDEGFGGEVDYDGNTCGKDPAEYFDAFLTESITDEIVSNFRFQVTAQGVVGDLDEYNSGAYTLYVNVGRAVLISAPGSDSSPTTKTITPVVVKVADSITNMKNKTYISKNSMKIKLRENNLFKYSASDSFKYQVFKSSKKSCGMRGNYVMRYENSKTCDLYITRTNTKGISNKYWVKINYLK